MEPLWRWPIRKLIDSILVDPVPHISFFRPKTAARFSVKATCSNPLTPISGAFFAETNVLPGRGLVQYIASQAEHHQKINFQDELREILRSTGSPSTSVTYGTNGSSDLPRFQRWVVFGESFLGLASF